MKRLFLLTSVCILCLVSFQSIGQSFQDFYNGLPAISIPYNFSSDQHTLNMGQVLPYNLQNQNDDFSGFEAVGKVDLENNYYFILIKKQSLDDGAEIYILLSIDDNENIISSLVVGVENSGEKGTDFKIESNKTLRVGYFGEFDVNITDYTFNQGQLSSDSNTTVVSLVDIENM